MSKIINIFPDKVEEIQEKFIAKWYEKNGAVLDRSDSRKLILDTMAYGFALLGADLNKKVEQNLLRYSEGTYLDELGEFKGVKRLEPQPAKTTVEFEINEGLTEVITIPALTITSGNNVFFETERVNVATKETIVETIATCKTAGEIGNGYIAGEINKLVTNSSYVKSVVNKTESQGGFDYESDENYRERIQIAPETYSVAGSKKAYEYWTKSADSRILDVVVYTSEDEAGKVHVVILLEGGEYPDEDGEICKNVESYLSDSKVRPLTDVVIVEAPEAVEFDIELDYYISSENKTIENEIKSEVAKAITDYITWQTEKIGRDVNPSELIYKLGAAGAKRVVVTKPIYTQVENNQSARLVNNSYSYKGMEDD